MLQARYGGTDPIFFEVTKDGLGVTTTLSANDVRLSKDGASGGSIIDVTAQCTEVDGTNLKGTFFWTPSGTQLQCKTAILYIKDYSGGGAFDENKIHIYTGGDANAYLDGT